MSGQLFDTGKRKRSFGVCFNLNISTFVHYNFKQVQAPLGSKNASVTAMGCQRALSICHRRGSEGSLPWQSLQYASGSARFSGVLGLEGSCFRVPFEVACRMFCSKMSQIWSVQRSFFFESCGSPTPPLLKICRRRQLLATKAKRFEAVARLWTHG